MRCGQERLDLLVRWCQLIGLVPFRMERDAESGRFLSYSFSWRHPLTYWWLTCKILYVTAYVSYNLNRWTTLEKKVAIYQSTKTEILVLFVGTVFSATTCLFIPETLVFRCSYFSKASRHLHEFDTLLEDHHVPACSTRKFTVIGIVSALVLVFGPLCLYVFGELNDFFLPRVLPMDVFMKWPPLMDLLYMSSMLSYLPTIKLGLSHHTYFFTFPTIPSVIESTASDTS